MAKPEIDESAPTYNVITRGRHVEITDPIRDYVEEKVSKIDRLHGRVLDVVVTLEVIKLEHRVDIVLNVDHIKIAVHASTDNLYASIDKATDRLQRKLRRYRKRIIEHRNRSLSAIDINVNVLEPPSELDDINDAILEETEALTEALYEPHSVSKKKSILLKTLSVDEAVLKMELSDYHFLVFRDEETQKLKVIYRRRDESYGIIEPE